MSPRFIFLIIGGILIYLTLSFYHGHKLKQLPDRIPGSTSTSLSATDQEKNWVQVTTSEEENGSNLASRQTTDKPEQRTDLPGEVEPKVVLPAVNRDKGLRQLLHTAAEKQTKLQQALTLEQKKNQALTLEKENLLFKIKALQGSLQEIRVESQAREGKLQDDNARQVQELDRIKKTTRETDALKRSAALKSDALDKANKRIDSLAMRLQDSSSQILDAEKMIKELNRSLVREQKARQQILKTGIKLQHEVDLAREEEEQRLAEVGRLHGQLKKMRSRLILTEGEIDRARLKAEAMLRYGQEQTKLITPFRQEIEILNGRLQDANARLLEGEQTIAELEESAQQLRQQLTDLQAERTRDQEEIARLAETEQSLTESKNKENELIVMLKELGNQLNERETRISSLNQSVAALEKTVLETEQETTDSRKESAKQQDSLNEMGIRIQGLQVQLDEALLARDSLQTKLQQTEKKSAELTGLNTHQQKQLQSAVRKAADLDKSLQKKSAALLKLEARHKKKESTIKELNKKLRSTEKRLGTIESQLKELQQTASVHKSMVLEKERKAADLQTRLTSLQKQLDAGEQQVKETAALMSAGKKENRELKEQLRQVREKNKQSGIQEKELAETKELLAALQGETSALKSELELRERSYFTLQEELSGLQVQHEKLLQERKQLLLQTTDGDNDGVPDSDDTCPDTAGNVEVDSRGCEKDSDSDGLVNRLDLCPDSPADTPVDQLGCPPDQPVILSNVRFESGTAELPTEAIQSLDKLTTILQHSPTLNIEIGGHTDSIGEEERNLTVSRKRAEAVAGYLVDHGIPDNRITAIGYGPELPVADNNTQAGRTANRRVELKIVSPVSEFKR